MTSTVALGAKTGSIRLPELALRYPRVAAYLASLPAGLDSYPECRTRSSVAESLLRARPSDLSAAAPPPFVAGLFAPCLRSWIPEVRLEATALAIADHARMSDEQFLAWTHQANAAMYRSPAYRALMTLLSPQLLFRCGAARWSVFHEGTRLAVEEQAPGCGSAVLTFPPQLFTDLLLRQFAEAFRAALVHSRAKQSRVELADVTPTSARFIGRWS